MKAKRYKLSRAYCPNIYCENIDNRYITQVEKKPQWKNSNTPADPFSTTYKKQAINYGGGDDRKKFGKL